MKAGNLFNFLNFGAISKFTQSSTDWGMYCRFCLSTGSGRVRDGATSEYISEIRKSSESYKGYKNK